MDVVEIFFSFADEDGEFYHKLRKHLSLPERDGQIHCRSREDVRAGDDIARASQRLLESAAILVLLISPTYLATSEQYQELELAIERQNAGQARVVPVLLKPGNYEGAAFHRLKPANTTPISQASNADKLYSEIATTITKLAQQ
ncbi:MAG: toll/interleukin-1 receptor domain-containing protein [Ktedonobacteraceae bacterium]